MVGPGAPLRLQLGGWIMEKLGKDLQRPILGPG